LLAVFDTATGRLIAKYESAHASPISAIAFSGDGTKLATADVEGTIKLWADADKFPEKATALRTLKGHRSMITTIGFSSDGKRLVSGSADKTVRVWDLHNADAAIRPLEGILGDCFVARFSFDGLLIAVAEGNRVRLWDAATGRLVRDLTVGDADRIFSVVSQACFAAGTPLLTPTGDKPIEQFKPGDWILTAPEEDPTAPTEAKQVEEVFRNEAVLWQLCAGGKFILTTAEHPFWVVGRGWTAARDLMPGDRLRSHDERWVTVEAARNLGEEASVYNLRIADYHTYFVGDESWGFSVWAHNSCYEVGTANNLRKTPQKGTQVNHAPQSREAELLVGNWNGANRAGNEAAIRLPISEHEAVTAAQAARSAPASARDLLASDIRILRNNTNAPNSALQELIQLNRDLHFWD
jgi:hypothetical protein